MGRHAEIAGAGFAGLVAAIALLERGWTVRVHERDASIRSEGYGIAIHENGIKALEAVGVLDEVLRGGLRIGRMETRDGQGRLTSGMANPARTYRISRQHMVRVFAERVAALGGELATGSGVAGADPSGALILEDGRRLPADLVVGADGYNSRVRDAVGLLRQRRQLGDGAMRLVIPAAPGERLVDDDGSTWACENWSGHRRVIYSPCSATEIYLAMSCLRGDREGSAFPIDVASWTRSFPHMADVFARIAAHADLDRVMWVRFQVIKLRAWSKGHVAILGDAANAMPPNLGQGGGCAMMNALALAVALDDMADVPAALAAWERRERPLTDHTQRWSALYSRTTSWPDWLRGAAFGLSTRSRYLSRQLRRTAAHVPTGYRRLEPATSMRAS